MIDKLSIAVLVFGRLNKSLAQYDNIINSIDKKHNLDFFCSSDNSDEKHLKEFIKKYKPKSYINDKIVLNKTELKFFWEYPKDISTNIDNMLKHFTNKNRVYNLLEKYIQKTNSNYNIILYLRVDVNITNKFNFEYPKDNTIYIPTPCYDFGGINDQIAYGNLYVMKLYSHILYNCKFILEKNLSDVHPERLTLVNLMLYNLNIQRFDLKYSLVHKIDLKYSLVQR